MLFTLAKEKYSDSWKVAVLTVIVDFLLIMAIMFNLEYPWAVDPHNGYVLPPAGVGPASPN